MADWKDWLDRGKQWASDTAGKYSSAGDQAHGIGAELAAKKQMMDEGKKALGPAPVAEPMAPPAAPTQMAPLDAVNPGYAPIGGQNALDQLYQGRPPALLPPPAAQKKFYSR